MHFFVFTFSLTTMIKKELLFLGQFHKLNIGVFFDQLFTLTEMTPRWQVPIRRLKQRELP